MSHEFIFGSQYLRGLCPTEDNWEKDMQTMVSLNFNTIRVWLVWGVLEPKEGEIDFKYIDKILNLAEQNELKVIFLFHMRGCPEWAVKKYRKYWYVNQHGEAFEPSIRPNTPSGGWPGLCPDNHEVQILEEQFIGTVCRHVGKRAFAYEPMNEPHSWVDYTRNPYNNYCYCEATRNLFKKWLMKKYGNLTSLEKAWGRRFDCLDSVRPPTWAFGYTDTSDWRTFITENIASLIERRGNVIRANSDVQVIAHALGGGSVTSTALGDIAFDDWKNAEVMDMWGCSAFLMSIGQTGNLGLAMDATRSAAAGKKFWQSELGCGELFGGFNRVPSASREVLSIWCWEAISHGINGLLFWQFSKERYANESGAYGLTDYAGELTERAYEVREIGRILRENANLFTRIEVPQAEVAIIFSFQSYILNWAECRDNKLCCDSLSGYYQAFWDHNIPVDILHEERVNSKMLNKYKMLILPMPVTLKVRFTSLLKQYVESGGTLLSDPMLCAWDENKIMSSYIPGGGLHELFGCEVDQTRSDYHKGFTLNMDGCKVHLSNTFFTQTWKNISSDATSFASYEDGSAAIVSRLVGRGRTIITGVNLGKMNSLQTSVSDDFHRETINNKANSAANIILRFANEAGVRSKFKLPLNFRIKNLTAKSNELLIIFEFEGSGGICELEHKPSGNKTWRNLKLNENGVFVNGKTTLNFRPFETKVLVLESNS